MKTAEQGRILDFGTLFGRWEITRSTEETRGELLEVRVEAQPGDGPPIHVHRHAEESYLVFSGVLEVNVEGAWKRVAAGETLTVPVGKAHAQEQRTRGVGQHAQTRT